MRILILSLIILLLTVSSSYAKQDIRDILNRSDIINIMSIIDNINIEIEKDLIDLNNGKNIYILANKYQIPDRIRGLGIEAITQELSLRINTLPTDFVLAVMGLETGFIRSRFSKKCNSLFSEKHLIYKHNRYIRTIKCFKSHKAAVISFFHLINTYSAYNSLRVARALKNTPKVLIAQLKPYSITKNYTQRVYNVYRTIVNARSVN